MNILHIANSYGGTEVYTRLFSELDASLGCRQQVFVPLNSRNHDRVGKKPIPFSVEGSALHYSTRLKWWHKFLYRRKIAVMTKALEAQIDLAEVDVVHAHMLCSDGAVAYELFRRHGKPYVVTVRNTDLNDYYRLFPWERRHFADILDSAARVVFLSPKYRRKLAAYCHRDALRDKVLHHSSVIPSGIAPVFLQRRHVHGDSPHVPAKLVFAGAFYPGKGLKETIEATDILRRKGVEVELTAVGRGLAQRVNDRRYISLVEDMAEKRPWIRLKDSMPHGELVKELREGDIFVMPSAPESFGLVYVEALSQGLPLVYTKGEGFDGYYGEGEVGWAVDPKNPSEIADKIGRILADYAGFSRRVGALDLERDFSWPRVAGKFKKLYDETLEREK